MSRGTFPWHQSSASPRPCRSRYTVLFHLFFFLHTSNLKIILLFRLSTIPRVFLLLLLFGYIYIMPGGGGRKIENREILKLIIQTDFQISKRNFYGFGVWKPFSLFPLGKLPIFFLGFFPFVWDFVRIVLGVDKSM